MTFDEETSDDSVSYFEIAEMDHPSIRARIENTLARHPLLETYYDDEFITDLIGDRYNFDNYLLWLLTEPAGSVGDQFWRHIIEDMSVLAPEGADQLFSHRLRSREQEPLESARVELELAAWHKRKGRKIDLQPIIPGAGKQCEFRAASTPETWWEVKTVLDEGYLREDEQSYIEVARRLRSIDEPFVLHVEHCALLPEDAAAAIRHIKREIRDFYQSGGEPPVRFEALGLVVEVACRTKRLPRGYLGSSITDVYQFGSEHIQRVLKKICSAVGQLPKGKAGVVVVNTSLSSWISHDTVEDACYGEFGITTVHSRNGIQIHNTRSVNAVFRPNAQTRVSAVIWYRRKSGAAGLQTLMTAYHNPYAVVPIPSKILASPNMKQIERIELSSGGYMLKEV